MSFLLLSSHNYNSKTKDLDPMKKPPYYFTDARHFLDENGLVPDNIPALAKKLISFLGQIMEEASLNPPGEDIETSLKCRRRPSRKPCPGKILAMRETDEGPILWKCDHRGTGGENSKWRGTQWDNSMGTVH
jgi:hypothetical protein